MSKLYVDETERTARCEGPPHHVTRWGASVSTETFLFRLHLRILYGMQLYTGSMLRAVLLLCCMPPTIWTVLLKIGYDVMSSMFHVYSVLNNEIFSVCLWCTH